MGQKMFREQYFTFCTFRVPLNESILYMHISTNTPNIGIDQLISSHCSRKLRKSKMYLDLPKSLIKTLSLVVHCAAKCLIEWRVCYSREKKKG